MPQKTCTECGGPIKQPKGRGRPRVYCGQLCRNAAYEKRRGAKPRTAAAAKRKQTDEGQLTVGDVLQMEIDGTYDAIIATELVEHLVDPETLLRRLPALLNLLMKTSSVPPRKNGYKAFVTGKF